MPRLMRWSEMGENNYFNSRYMSATVYSNTGNSKFHLIRIFGQIVFATLSSSYTQCRKFNKF